MVASLGSLFRHGDPCLQAFALLATVEEFDFYKWENQLFLWSHHFVNKRNCSF